MNNNKHTLLKLLSLALVICGASLATRAQTRYPAQLQIESLEPLAVKANQIVDVNLDERLLRLIPVGLMHSTDPDAKNIKEIVAGLKGVYVKNFEFNNEGEYGEADIAAIRTQLRAPGWVRFVNVINKKEHKNVEVYLMTGTTGARVEGLAILAAEPKELTVVNIVGIIDIEKLSKLEGQFGIPDLGIEPDDADKPEAKKPEKPATATKKP
ncbi:MAG: hypothetical protein DMF64_10265 [Acidobacteria bacterium]|nr:MAG: hypothetical protein DMF64_10265 [Acidobacteriota bacterium]